MINKRLLMQAQLKTPSVETMNNKIQMKREKGLLYTHLMGSTLIHSWV